MKNITGCVMKLIVDLPARRRREDIKVKRNEN